MLEWFHDSIQVCFRFKRVKKYLLRQHVAVKKQAKFCYLRLQRSTGWVSETKLKTLTERTTLKTLMGLLPDGVVGFGQVAQLYRQKGNLAVLMPRLLQAKEKPKS